MSLLNKLLGNAVTLDKETAEQKVSEIVIEGEQVVIGFQLIRDSIVFTSERLVMIDVQGLTGSKTSYTSIPFSSIKWFSMENAGTFDMDSEIQLAVQRMNTPLSLKFKKGTDIKLIYQLLSTYTLRDN
ncbi:MAG: PH domain-containing protein [Patescibacteria group bacterium]